MNTYHRTIKMKTVTIHINFNKDNNKEGPKFKVGDRARISKHSLFAKGYVRNWSEKVFVIKKVKNTVPRTYVISDLKDDKIVGTFYQQELQKPKQKEFRIEEIIKRKDNKLYVK